MNKHQLIPRFTYFFKDYNNLISSSYPQYVLTLNDQEEETPFQKIINYGPQSLKAAELLSLILDKADSVDDNLKENAENTLDLCQRILHEYGEKNIINQTDTSTLSAELNISLKRASQIVACFELGRRFFKKNTGGPVIIRTAKQAYDYLKDMRKLPKEHMRGIYLNSRYRLIHDEVISVGTLTANIVHPREIFRPALEYSAAAVIIAHNHPSGSLKPTKSDLEITRQIIKAGEILGIDLLDHIIIAGSKYSSIMNLS